MDLPSKTRESVPGGVSQPATVHVQRAESGFELEYPRQAIRRESFSLVNNWWVDARRSKIVMVLGRQPIERCVIAIDDGELDATTRDWLFGYLRARSRILL